LYIAWTPGRSFSQEIQQVASSFINSLTICIFFTCYWCPLGLMNFACARCLWAACNLLFTVIALWNIKGLFDQSLTQWGITCISFLCSTPFRNSLGNGQQTLLIVLLVALAYRATVAWQQGVWAGLSYFKYSFSLPVMVDLVFRRGLLIAALSVVPALIGFL
jgi:hypothetical protein